MTNDHERVWRFEEAVRLCALGRRVVDAGCGANLDWSLAALRAGAASVVAVEQSPVAFAAASEKLVGFEAGGRVELRQGRSHDLTLDDRADVLVTETVGAIAGSEGIARIVDDARASLLLPEAHVIPHEVRTVAALADLRTLLGGQAPSLGVLAGHYAEEIFEFAGSRFDLRLVVSDPYPSGVHSESGTVERITLNPRRSTENEQATRVRVSRGGTVDGVALWLQMTVHPDVPVLGRTRRRDELGYRLLSDLRPPGPGFGRRLLRRVLELSAERRRHPPRLSSNGRVRTRDLGVRIRLPRWAVSPFVAAFAALC